MFFETKDSSAIKEITVEDNIVSVIFKSSDKEYKYEVKDEEFTNNLQNTIVNEDSIGKFINQSIKNKLIVELNTTTTIW